MKLTKHNIFSLIFALALPVSVELLIVSGVVSVRIISLLVLSYLAITVMYHNWYLHQSNITKPWVLARYSLFLLSWYAVYTMLPSVGFRVMFLLITVPLFFAIHNLIAATGERLLVSSVIITAAMVLLAVSGLSHYYMLPSLVFLLITFAATVVLVRTSFEFVPHGVATKWLGAALVALLMTEFFWVLSFLPLHFTATAGILFALFYSFWTVYYYYLYNHLTIRRVQFHLLLTGAFVVVILLSTPWRILT